MPDFLELMKKCEIKMPTRYYSKTINKKFTNVEVKKYELEELKFSSTDIFFFFL